MRRLSATELELAHVLEEIKMQTFVDGPYPIAELHLTASSDLEIGKFVRFIGGHLEAHEAVVI